MLWLKVREVRLFVLTTLVLLSGCRERYCHKGIYKHNPFSYLSVPLTQVHLFIASARTWCHLHWIPPPMLKSSLPQPELPPVIYHGKFCHNHCNMGFFGDVNNKTNINVFMLYFPHVINQLSEVMPPLLVAGDGLVTHAQVTRSLEYLCYVKIVTKSHDRFNCTCLITIISYRYENFTAWMQWLCKKHCSPNY